MATTNRVKAIPLGIKNSNTVGASYAVVSTLAQACFLIRINNASNQAITISYDGIVDHDYLAAGAALYLNFQSNAQPNGFVALMGAGTSIYVKGTGGVGFISISGYYLV